MSDSIPEDAYKDEQWLRQKYVDEEMSSVDIAELFDVTAPSICRYLRKYDINHSSSTQLTDHQKEIRDDPEWLREQYIHLHRTTADIGDEVGVAPTTIGDWLEKHNIDKRPKGTRLDPDHIVRNQAWLIRKYKFERLSIVEIANKAGVNHKTVRGWMERFGIERRDPGDWEMPHYSQLDDSNPIKDEDWIRRKHFEEFWSVGEIAEEASVAPPTVYTYAEKFDIDLKSEWKTSIDKDNPIRDPDWIREKYVEEGLKTSELAELADINRGTAERWMDRFGIERRDPVEARAEVDISLLKDEEWLREKYIEEDLSIADICDIIGCGRKVINTFMDRYGIERPDPYATGPDAPNWRGGHDNNYGYLWPEQRAKALRRDQHRCQRCGITEPEHREQADRGLHVHHKTPYREFEDDEEAHNVENLISLCDSCHMIVEYDDKQAVELQQ